jgi:4-hydroxybenzoate polyprenyltransferase
MAAPKNRNYLGSIRDLLIHLRLPFQLLLAPIFLWGYFLADGQPDLDFWLAFAAFHVFLYGGMTAFNSYYDRDEGPVGGLAKPPPVRSALLPFSLIVQCLGGLLAALVNLGFLLIYLVIFVMGLAYSLPHIRLKGRPLLGLATVGLGQGVLASLGGWVTAEPDLTRVDGLAWLGILAVTLITIGFYPLTQIYQIDEDLARGDWTFSAWAGPRRAFLFALAIQSMAVILLADVMNRLLGPGEALIVAGFYGVLLVATVYWAYTFDQARVMNNYRWVMGINGLTSLGFTGFLILHLWNIP